MLVCGVVGHSGKRTMDALRGCLYVKIFVSHCGPCLTSMVAGLHLCGVEEARTRPKPRGGPMGRWPGSVGTASATLERWHGSPRFRAPGPSPWHLRDIEVELYYKRPRTPYRATVSCGRNVSIGAVSRCCLSVPLSLRRQKIISAAKWMPRIELECRGKRALMLGGACLAVGARWSARCTSTHVVVPRLCTVFIGTMLVLCIVLGHTNLLIRNH